jgi:hypothetical protein
MTSRSDGEIGSLVPGFNGGGSGSGRSGSMLYHFFGISSGESVVRIVFKSITPSAVRRW